MQKKGKKKTLERNQPGWNTQEENKRMKKSAVAERAGKELKFKLSAHCLVRVGWLRGGFRMLVLAAWRRPLLRRTRSWRSREEQPQIYTPLIIVWNRNRGDIRLAWDPGTVSRGKLFKSVQVRTSIGVGSAAAFDLVLLVIHRRQRESWGCCDDAAARKFKFVGCLVQNVEALENVSAVFCAM